MNQISRVATETALSIPEILSLIFSELPPGTQAACACVCKQWSEVALDELWRDLQGVHPLLKLVIYDGPFYNERSWTASGTVNNIFRLLRDADWSRFREYAVRVASIEFDEKLSANSLPSGQAIAALCFHHRFGSCLTPNVRRIRWGITSKKGVTLMMPFISASLEELKLELNGEAEESFLYLAHRTPSLKKLYIASEESPSNLSTSFSRWIQTCVELEEVHIPRGWHTSTILAAFESLPNLFEFGIQWTSPPGDRMEVETQAIIKEGCFRSLRHLGLSSNITQVTDLLRQTSGQLQGLTLDCRGASSRADIETLLTTVVERCPQLDRFCLNLAEISNLASFTFNILRSLLACKTLTGLRIHYSAPCIVSNSDFEDIGTAWPTMEELVLCPDPAVTGSTRGTAISTLSHAATVLPQLRVLGLHFDPLEPPGLAGDLLPESQFRCLGKLDVGTSQVPKVDPTPVGLYLASLFAVGTRPSIHAGVSEVRATDRSGHSAACVDGWRQVERSVHLTLGVKEAIDEGMDACHRTALSIPEILSLIFAKAPPETQAACACVCKKWSEVDLWRDPEDVYSLLKLAIDDDSFYDGRSEMDDETLERIRDADWPRLRKYATRVVFINFYEYPSARPLPSKAGIAFLCLHHRFGACFTPNVRKIRWKMNSKKGATLMMPFISEKLEEIHL